MGLELPSLTKNNMKQEVRNLYLAVIGPGGIFRDIRKMIKCYEEFHEFKARILNDPNCPNAIRNSFVVYSNKDLEKESPFPVTPKYLIWAKQFIKEDDVGEKND